MAKAKEPVITVSTVFAGRQTDRQAFIDLIIQKKEIAKSQVALDIVPSGRYNEITPNCGIHSRTEVINED
ncbi:MAG: hypothetical protein K2O45_08040 [Oscillospiraceae bacterium]|nr:hypothetical protein [Oscillospiraceae bacterium]